MRRKAAAAFLVLATVAAAGCGRERVDPPDTVRPAAPQGTGEEAFPKDGLTLERPGNWPFRAGRPPLVASTSNGTATVALWRYLRSEPLPSEDEQLEAAQASLEQAVKARDATFALERSTRLEVDGAPAIELRGIETIAGRKRRVRSTHVYAKEAEIVLDAYAAVEDFDRVDSAVFDPIVKSLRIDPPEGTP